MPEKKPLYQEISTFQKYRKAIAIFLIILGIVGILLPLLPAIIFIVIGIILLFPGKYEALSEWIKTRLVK
ncbi:MAG: hypothetical protein ACE5QV_00420 [Fidelibacterota bacterium]